MRLISSEEFERLSWAPSASSPKNKPERDRSSQGSHSIRTGRRPNAFVVVIELHFHLF